MFYKILRWARIIKPATDDKQFLTQQISYLGKTSESLMVYPYGMLANIPADNLALLLSIQSDSNRASFGIDTKSRIELTEGEVSIYSPTTGAFMIFRTNGDIDIVAGSSNVNIAGDVNITGNLTLTGDMDVTGAMTNNGSNVGDTHGHTQPADSNGDTEAPISGVT